MLVLEINSFVFLLYSFFGGEKAQYGSLCDKELTKLCPNVNCYGQKIEHQGIICELMDYMIDSQRLYGVASRRSLRRGPRHRDQEASDLRHLLLRLVVAARGPAHRPHPGRAEERQVQRN